MSGKSIELLDGKQLAAWMYSDDLSLINVMIFYNGVTLLMPTEDFSELVDELSKVALKLRTMEKQN